MVKVFDGTWKDPAQELPRQCCCVLVFDENTKSVYAAYLDIVTDEDDNQVNTWFSWDNTDTWTELGFTPVLWAYPPYPEHVIGECDDY